jgi:hypothetical protein
MKPYRVSYRVLAGFIVDERCAAALAGQCVLVALAGAAAGVRRTRAHSFLHVFSALSHNTSPRRAIRGRNVGRGVMADAIGLLATLLFNLGASGSPEIPPVPPCRKRSTSDFWCWQLGDSWCVHLGISRELGPHLSGHSSAQSALTPWNDRVRAGDRSGARQSVSSSDRADLGIVSLLAIYALRILATPERPIKTS